MQRFSDRPSPYSLMTLSIILVAGFGSTALAGQLQVPSQYPTIQEAINAAVAGDEVVIAPALYIGILNRNLDCGGKAITIRSSNPSDPSIVANTIIDCQGDPTRPTRRGFYFHSGESHTTVLDGLTIRNGCAGGGGGIMCSNSGPVIRRCNVLHCLSNGVMGGGILLDNSTASVDSCVLEENESSGNDGGGISCRGSNSPVIKNCLITNNVAGRYGGGIEGTNYELLNCLVARNSAPEGGGICDWGFVTIRNCTVSNNTATIRAGGLMSFGSADVMNCIFWDNTAPPPKEISGASAAWSDVQGGAGGRFNISLDPLFVGASAGNYRLSPGSPCIDAADNTSLLAGMVTDLAGNPRLVDDVGTPDNGNETPPPVVDMGAYEFQGSSSPPPDADLDGVPDDEDACPNTISGVTADAVGCPPIVRGDLDRDGDVDMDDFAILQRCARGPNVPGDPNCN